MLPWQTKRHSQDEEEEAIRNTCACSSEVGIEKEKEGKKRFSWRLTCRYIAETCSFCHDLSAIRGCIFNWQLPSPGAQSFGLEAMLMARRATSTDEISLSHYGRLTLNTLLIKSQRGFAGSIRGITCKLDDENRNGEWSGSEMEEVVKKLKMLGGGSHGADIGQAQAPAGTFVCFSTKLTREFALSTGYNRYDSEQSPSLGLSFA
ncbi:hypothetical protein WN48_09971 [Eufriesea mexicana]|uniref:Uncharacterized protein n=1 Tax=Eufriesea mexicana TaxID=516756 RepID=A0A310SEJ2_9HYME|nr:hypothetical protein WN48_09971 [Eufriesea mexicana]